MCAEGGGKGSRERSSLLHVTFLSWSELSHEEFSNPRGVNNFMAISFAKCWRWTLARADRLFWSANLILQHRLFCRSSHRLPPRPLFLLQVEQRGGPFPLSIIKVQGWCAEFVVSLVDYMDCEMLSSHCCVQDLDTSQLGLESPT